MNINVRDKNICEFASFMKFMYIIDGRPLICDTWYVHARAHTHTHTHTHTHHTTPHHVHMHTPHIRPHACIQILCLRSYTWIQPISVPVSSVVAHLEAVIQVLVGGPFYMDSRLVKYFFIAHPTWFIYVDPVSYWLCVGWVWIQWVISCVLGECGFSELSTVCWVSVDPVSYRLCAGRVWIQWVIGCVLGESGSSELSAVCWVSMDPVSYRLCVEWTWIQWVIDCVLSKCGSNELSAVLGRAWEIWWVDASLSS